MVRYAAMHLTPAVPATFVAFSSESLHCAAFSLFILIDCDGCDVRFPIISAILTSWQTESVPSDSVLGFG